MYRCVTWLVLAVTLVSGAASARDTSDLIRVNGHLCAPDRVLIRFRPELFRTRFGGAGPANRDLLRAALGLPAGIAIADGGFTQWRKQKGEMTAHAVDLDTYQVIRLNGEMSIEECLRRLDGHPLLEYAEPDGISFGGAIVPSDPDYSNQWHHATIQSSNAWGFVAPLTVVTAAVLDTGLNMTLSEFTNRLVQGYDFANGDSNPTDDHGHGTIVAGILGANANNGVLGVGVDWSCKIMPIKVWHSGNTGDWSWSADGVYYAVSNGARVINYSGGGSSMNMTMLMAVLHAAANDVIFVTITHNANGPVYFPGTVSETITVGATDADDGRSSFSNYGPEIDLVAPGRDIATVSRWGTLEYWWGTSMSAPQVAGVATIIAAMRPGIDNEVVRSILCAGAEDQVGDALDTPGFDNYYGWGRLNAYHSLILAHTALRHSETSGTPVLSWNASPNAADKNPYCVQLSTNLASGQFSTVTRTNIAYVGTQAYYNVQGTTESHAIYRLGISRQ